MVAHGRESEHQTLIESYPDAETTQAEGQQLGVRILWPLVMVLLVLGIAVSKFNAGHSVGYLALSLWALRGPRAAIQALSLSWLLTVMNPSLIALPSIQLRWIVVAAAGLTILRHLIYRKSLSVLRPLLLFSVIVGVLSFFSYAPDISLLKVSVFALGITAIIGGFHLTREQPTYWDSWFFTLYIFILVTSATLLGDPIGYLRNESGFQGILNHPQAFGIFVASLTALLVGSTIKPGNKLSRVIPLGLLATTGMAFTYLSRSRGSAISLGVGLVAMGLYSLSARSRQPATTRRRWLYTAGILATALLMMGPITGRSGLSEFVLKGGNSQTLYGAFDESRGALIERSIENFLGDPLTGIGFGLPSDPNQLNVEMNTLGLPTGAPVEKGNFLSTLLEETGIIGTFAFIMLLVPLAMRVSKLADPAKVGLLAAALATNLGESTLFSIGGMGLFIWLVIGWTSAPLAHGSRWHRPRLAGRRHPAQRE